MKREKPYNPLDKQNLGISVTDALLARTPSPLPPRRPFQGAGVYAIYYVGDFPPYEPIAALNRDGRLGMPIYVGKAIPPGGRKGSTGLETQPTDRLYKRLVEHADSITLAENLDLRDFKCRYLVVDDIWIPLGESLLITRYRPLWNTVLGGFGNHDPGAGRYQGMRPLWDVMHPGREWAARCQENPSIPEDIICLIEKSLRHPR